MTPYIDVIRKFIIGFIFSIFCFMIMPFQAFASIELIEEVTHRSKPDYICVVEDCPSTDRYRYYSEEGIIKIKDCYGTVFAEEYTGADASKGIWVYVITSDTSIVPLLNEAGQQVMVSIK